MPTFTHGKNVKVFANGYDLSSYFSSVTASGTADTAEVTTFGLNSKAYIPGNKDATVSAEGFYAGGAGDVDERLAAQIGEVAVWTTIMGADALGARGYGIQTVDTAYEVGAEIGGAVAVSAEGQSIVGLEPVVVLNPLSAKTATGTGTQVDGTASTLGGASAYLHVTAKAGTDTPTLTVKVQHSADASTWADLITFSAVTAANGYQRLSATGTVNRYLRAAWTISGTNPSFTFHLSAARL